MKKMESSQVFGGEEECHSSESGWTMYIGSPDQGEDDYSDPNGQVADGEADKYEQKNWDTNHDANSDDSMASDASSGPSLREKTWEIKKGGRHDSKVDRNHSSKYKDKKPVKKNRHEKRNDQEKDEAEVTAKGLSIMSREVR